MNKMAREGRIRKPRRRDWPAFLKRVIPTTVWQSLATQLPISTDPRIRWTVQYMVLCTVLMGWSMEMSITQRFREAHEVLVRLFPSRRRPGRSYPGLTKAIGNASAAPAPLFWKCLRETFPKRLGRVWMWYGWVLIAVDGSRIDAPRTRRNQRGLGKPCKNKTHPQWWVTTAVHLPSSVMWDWRQGPGDSSERDHLRAMIPDVPTEALLVADAGYVGFELMVELHQSGRHFLIRCGSNVRLLVEETLQHIERRGECRYVYLWPKLHRKQDPLRLRLIVLKSRGKRVYLLTNVLDSRRLSRKTASTFYRARWGVEVHYRSLKQTLGHCNLLAKTPEPGGCELAGYLVALGLLMLQGALVLGARAPNLSVAAALRAVRWAIRAVIACLSSAAFVERLCEAIQDSYQRHSSKKARDWPLKKRYHPAGAPRVRKPTKTEKARLHAA